MRWFLAILVVAGVAIAVAWGPRAAFVYAFFAGIAGVLSYAAAAGGGWLERTSRGRFDDERRRRR